MILFWQSSSHCQVKFNRRSMGWGGWHDLFLEEVEEKEFAIDGGGVE